MSKVDSTYFGLLSCSLSSSPGFNPPPPFVLCVCWHQTNPLGSCIYSINIGYSKELIGVQYAELQLKHLVPYIHPFLHTQQSDQFLSDDTAYAQWNLSKAFGHSTAVLSHFSNGH